MTVLMTVFGPWILRRGYVFDFAIIEFSACMPSVHVLDYKCRQ